MLFRSQVITQPDGRKLIMTFAVTATSHRLADYRARGGYASADCEIWDDQGQLVAFATQTMILRRRPEQAPAVPW